MRTLLPLLMLMLGGFIAMGAPQASYVGDARCVKCHKEEHGAWKGSHHALAMQPANVASVLGDFNESTFVYNGITTTFFEANDTFKVRTDGADGKLHTYDIAYTFGVYPLQQYMVKFPKGRMQLLDIAWDSRPKSQGGQRWFHLHPDDNVTAGDPLHWTGPNLNWNYMCADCHSTRLKKNYDMESDSYHTSWQSINVSCEACHGPASAHLAWASTGEGNVSHHGFAFSLKRDGASTRQREIELCAQCHARRMQLDDDFRPGDALLDHYLPVTLDRGLYFPDGKMQDEVYVYDSFLQSKMYEKGVTCSDCHDPHGLQRRAKGDAVCFRCHAESTYAAKSHHFHEKESPGARCVNCHMPPRTYMGVDVRNDHSFRIPRPDISVALPEVPNACNLCHRDRNASWAAETLKRWYGHTPRGKQDFAHALHSLRENLAEGPKRLDGLLKSDAPTLAKATAVGYLGRYPSRHSYATLRQQLRHSDALVRRKALEALEGFPAEARVPLAFGMLSDPVKAVRIEAARQLAAFPPGGLDAPRRKVLEKALREYEATLRFNADRAESRIALAQLHAFRGKNGEAEAAYEAALKLQPHFVPAYVNYSDFLAKIGKEKEAYTVLRRGMEAVPRHPVLTHALGLWYVRNGRKEEGVAALKQALELSPDNPRFAYVYGVAISEKDPQEAITVLEKAYRQHTGDRDLLSALVYYSEAAGQKEKAMGYRRALDALNRSLR
jgi:tetratricopeptide (TPR) repeat protein